MRARVVALSLAGAMTATLPPLARTARADEGGTAAAESLFQQGRKLMAKKKYAEACPKFLASEKLAPAVGTLLNLADCYEKNGQLASAWARFHEAIAMAQRFGREDRERTARRHAERLEPRLIRLTVLAEDPSVDVKLDDLPLDKAVLGTPIPVDAGEHTITASAEGKKPFSKTIEVSEDDKRPTVKIPALEAAPESAEAPSKQEPEEPKRKEEGAPGGTQRTLGIVAGAAGVVGLGVGAFFGLRTSSRWSEAQTHCAGVDCDAAGVTLAGQAKTSGYISTAAFVAGGVLLAGGLALYFTAPRASDDDAEQAKESARRAVGLAVGPGSVVLGGTF